MKLFIVENLFSKSRYYVLKISGKTLGLIPEPTASEPCCATDVFDEFLQN